MSSEQLWLREDFRCFWQGQDAFAAAFTVRGDSVRALEQRQTLAFELGGQRYFIKRHRGARWAEIFKNLVQGRLPVISARNEYRALCALDQLGVRVPVPAAYGRRGWLPHMLASFLVTEDVGPHQSLEDLCRDWRTQPPVFALKRDLIRRVATIARTLHGNGICHRDFYLCHFLRTSDGKLTLIDLHRALVKRHLPQRWIIKDLAGLYFSALDCGLTRRDLLRFMREYHHGALRQTLQRDAVFWRRVLHRAQRIHDREQRKTQPLSV